MSNYIKLIKEKRNFELRSRFHSYEETKICYKIEHILLIRIQLVFDDLVIFLLYNDRIVISIT